MESLEGPQSQALSKISTEGFKKAISILDDGRNIDARTRLLPVEICQAVVERIDREPPHADQAGAGKLATLLLACYPDFRAHDQRKYLEQLLKTFEGFAYSVGQRVVHPVTGLPGRLKFNPKIADVLEALKAEARRLEIIRANALSHIGERRRRERWAAEEAKYAQSTTTIEARREQVARALGSLQRMKNPMQQPLSGLTTKPAPSVLDPDLPASDELKGLMAAAAERPGPE